jgi:hypothetical protein
MAKERITNSFEGGMNNDLDPKLRQPNTYEMSINGRIVYNQDGTLSWETANGNVEAITGLSDNDAVIGSVDFPDFVILFVKNATDKESKLMYVRFTDTGSGTVHSLFTSDDDPSKNYKFDFNVDYPIKAKAFVESEDLMRVYWTDNLNEPRVFSFKNTGTSHVVLEAVTGNIFETALTPDWIMPEITYRGLIDGSLRTGIYQYALRCKTRDGYQTPWSPISYPIIVTGDKPEINSPSIYGMKDVDEIGSTGTRLTIMNVDRRFYEYEVAYVHTITDSGVKEAGIVATGIINDDLFTDTNNPEIVNGQQRSTLAIEHTSIENSTPINVEDLSDLKDVIVKAKTLEIHDNRLWFGNTETKKTFSIPDSVFDSLTVEPVIRGLVADRSSRNIGFNGTSKSTVMPDFGGQSFLKRRYNNSYLPIYAGDVKSEFYNYQSSVVCNHFTGYFRGETYRFAAVFFDKKGYPFFAKHLGDVEMPLFTSSEDNNPFSWRRIKDDGDVTSKVSIDIGKMGGIPTESQEQYVDIVDSGDGDRRLYNKASGISAVGTGDDKIIESNGKYSDLRLINSAEGTHKLFSTYSPNDTFNSLDETGLWENGSNKVEKANTNSKENPIATRIMGIKFGGINLDVDIDGTPLRDLISGVLIVRAERTGADEQVKDSGAIFNCIDGGIYDGKVTYDSYDSEGRRAAVVNPFPHTGGTPDDGYSFEGLNTAIDDTDQLVNRPKPVKNLVSFDAINHKLTNEAPVVKTTTKLRLDYICDMSNIVYSDDHGITKRLWSDRHYITKNLSTYNTNANTTDTYEEADPTADPPVLEKPSWFNACGQYKDLRALIDAKVPKNSYGNIANRVVTTLTYMNYYANSSNTSEWETWAWDNYRLWKEYEGKGDEKLLRGVATRTLLLESAYDYMLARGQWSHIADGASGHYPNVGIDTLPRSSFYVASIVEPNSQPYGGLNLNALANTRFHTTGSFIPANFIPESGTLDDVEVWGGDCYLDLFSYARILPMMEAETDNDGTVEACIAPKGKQTNETGWSGDEFRDYAHGVVFPVQSKYNFRLTYKSASNGVPTFEEVLTANGATVGGAIVGLEGAESVKNYYNEHSLNGLFFNENDTCDSVEENFQIQKALLYTDKVRAYAPKPVDFVEATKYPTRWHWSNLKQPYNAKIDAFRQFEEISNYDLDGVYGDITGAVLMFDNIYSIQEKGFGRLRSSDRAVVNSGTLGDLQLGEGGVMDGIDYISKIYGTLYWQSIVSSGKNFYFVDSRMSKIIRFGQDGIEPISDSKGVHNFIEPYLKRLLISDGDYNIVSGYDYSNNDVVITINGAGNSPNYKTTHLTPSWRKIEIDTGNKSLPSNFTASEKTGSVTLLYNDVLQGFHGIHTYYPRHYVNFGNRLYVTKNDGRGSLYLQGKGEKGRFYDEYYYSMLRVNINKFANITKTFDNTAWSMNDDALSKIREVSAESEGVKHTYNNLSAVIANLASSYSTSNRAKYREGILRFPLREIDGSGKPRLRGKNMSLELWVENDSDNKKFSLTSIDTIVRV